MGAPAGLSEGRGRAAIGRLEAGLRSLWRSAFGARSPLVEDAGFKMPALHVYFHWAILGTLVLAVALSLALSATTSYDRGNYQYVLSAELQAVAAIFALVITGSLVAMQIVVGTTPRIMAYFPLKEFVVAVVVNAATMGFDAVTLARLPDLATYIGKFFINLTVVLNGVAVLATLAYVWWTFHWTQPRIYLTALLNRMDHTDDLQSQRDIVVAIEELGLHASDRRHIQTCGDAVRAFVVAADLVLAKSNLDTEAVGQDISHPLCTIPEALGRLGVAYAERGLDDAVHHVGWALGGLGAEYCAHAEELIDVELTMPVVDIAESCGRHSREKILYNFLASKNRCLSWLAAKGAHEMLRWWALNVEDEADICGEYKLPNAAAQVLEQLDTLLTLAEKRQLRDHFYDCGVRTAVDWLAAIGHLIDHAGVEFEKAAISGSTPWFERRTLGESVDGLRARLQGLRGADHAGSST